jgi:uncharacterized membrane protein
LESLFLAEFFGFSFILSPLISLGIQKVAWSVHGRSVLVLFAWMNRLVSQWSEMSCISV